MKPLGPSARRLWLDASTVLNPPSVGMPGRRQEDPHAMGRVEDGHSRHNLTGLVESRMRWKPHVRFGERAGKRTSRNADTAPRLDFTSQAVGRDDMIARRVLSVLVRGLEKTGGRWAELDGRYRSA